MNVVPPEPLSAVKQALLARRLRERQGADAPAEIPRRRDVARAPLAYAQEPLWVLEQRTPGLASYHIPILCRVVGPLDADALQAALAAVVARHEALRTTFAEIDGEPQAIVRAGMPVQLLRFAVAGDAIAPAEREAEALRLLSAAAAEPFAFENGPLLRAALAAVGHDEHLLAITVHHIVFDGGSVRVLLRDLDACYTAVRSGAPAALPALPIQFGDFAAWQRSEACAGRRELARAHWQRVLADAPRSIDLPTDRPRVAVPSAAAARRRMVLPADVWDELKEVARAHDATPFMVLLGAFQTLLHRYSAQDDIVVGSPVAGRVRKELEDVIGFVASPVPLRARFSDDTTFAQIVEQARTNCIAAYEHRDVPYDALVNESAGSGGAAYSVMFVLQDGATDAVPLGDALLQPIPLDNGASPFDLVLSAGDQADGLRATLQYRTELFDAATADRMLAHFATLLRAVCDDATRAVAALPLTTPDEFARLTAVPAVRQRRDATLPELFAEQVARRPAAIALVFEDVRISYGALDALANRVAHRLKRSGVGPGVAVGICLERGVELIVAMLGVLKAGGCYVPLDPALPRERLQTMLEDVRPQALLTADALRGLLPEGSHVVALDDLSTWAEPESAPAPTAGADDLAYVMYTSGSTGRPKGVMVTHRNVVGLFASTESRFHFDERDTSTLFHAYAFDFSVWEMWGALLYGGRLVVVPFWVSRSPADFVALLRSERVTVLGQTPSAFWAFLAAEAARPDRLTDLRLVFCGAESLEPVRLAPWFERYGDASPQFWNLYGPTETTVLVTARRLRAGDVRSSLRSPIGYPIDDVVLYVLDGARNPVPANLPGELYVGGTCVTRGYLNRPELTAERFVPDRFHPDRAGKLYRTGDRVRRRSNGELEYLGRIDEQIKISGFRVEPGEVEAALLALPSLRDAIVVARTDTSGQPRLVAYVVDDARPERRPDDLRRARAERLPCYLVPSRFVRLDALPVTANGKVDRAALPVPDAASEPSAAAPVPPRGELQTAVAQIFEDVLGRAGVGVDADFFELGGHSLHAMRVVARIEKLFRARVPLRTFFEKPTIAELARVVEAGEAKPGQAVAIARALAALERMTPDERSRRLEAVKRHE
ncbi:MAG: hypothetical protein NVSMB19_01500 [Vulcanimicrobiaceae bacterium]